ncbi:MAG: transglycosylase SLT domain-containing protein [Myxococcales bacterium]|nr:transglycosylase SLT domain-containing protein [Myxococcales bacterium]
MPTRHSSLLAAALAMLALGGPAQAKKKAESTDRVSTLEARLDALEAELARRPRDVSAYALPDEVGFCGEAINLGDPEVRERMEREFYLVLGDRAQVVLWIKRARSVFPIIEREAKALSTCADLKYLAVVESGLRPGVTSRAAAKGWWQFMSGTGKQYGLDIDRTWDQRADLGHATRAGLSYLKDLRGQFGSWPLAMAGYNTGPGRLRRAQEEQGQTDFWELDLYDEAERYVPRVIAIKTVMEHLDAYGFQLGIEDGWEPEQRGFVKVEVPRGHSIEVLAAARGSGIPYRTLRRMNPEMGAEVLPDGREVVIEVPQGKERQLRDWMTEEMARQTKLAKSPRKPQTRARSSRTAKRSESKGRGVASRATTKKRSRARAPRAKHYAVQPGDSLWSIAHKHDISIADLRTWNRLGSKDVLHPGQKLVVRPAK